MLSVPTRNEAGESLKCWGGSRNEYNREWENPGGKKQNSMSGLWRWPTLCPKTEGPFAKTVEETAGLFAIITAKQQVLAAERRPQRTPEEARRRR